MKNCIDMPIYHKGICAENVTNTFLIRHEKSFSRVVPRTKNVLGMEDIYVLHRC